MDYKPWVKQPPTTLWQNEVRSARPDRFVWVVATVAALLSLGSYGYYYWTNAILAYGDSMSHLMIAKRIISSPTPGVGQSGGLWPPLIHWLSLPFIKNDWMYRTGTAGSILSMAAYVITAVFVYKITRTLLPNGVRWPAATAALIVMTNRDMLYMQATPMTELPLLCCIVISVYYFIKWSQSEKIQYLSLCIASVLFATGVRYEGWALLVAMLAAIGYVAIRQRWGWLKSRDLLVYFGVFASVFIAYWILWNAIILGDPLGWIRGEYASPSNWVSQDDPTVGNPWRAFQVYWWAMQNINGLLLMCVGIAGLALFTFSHKLKTQSCGIYVLVFPILFYAPLLAAGQRPLHVPQVTGSMYNIRFALQTVPLFAIMAAFAAYMVLKWVNHRTLYQGAVVVMTLGLSLVIQPTSAITLQEPLLARDNARAKIQMEAAQCLSEIHRDHEMVLMETYGNERLLFESGIALDWVIYEGSNEDDLWQSALEHPANYVQWVVMRHGLQDPDKVWEQVYSPHPERLSEFNLVFTNGELMVYQHQSLEPRSNVSCTFTTPISIE
jgi:hypothetical protein